MGNAYIGELLAEHLEVFNKLIADEKIINQIEEVASVITASLKNGGRLLLCGNGGSASDAQHIAAELVGRFQKERKAYDAEALTINTSTLTAVTNDYGYDYVFARQVEAKGRKGDVLIGISSSGKSKNVLEALKKANEIGMITVMLMGDYEISNENDYMFIMKVPSKKTARVQEGHIFIGHTIAELVENKLVSEGKDYYGRD